MLNDTWLLARPPLLRFLGGMLFALSACGDSSQVCVTGETQACLCAGAEEGAQVCAADGLGWETCACDGGSDAVTDDDETDDDETDDDTSTGWDPTLAGDAEAGATLYAANCASCHGAQGQGTASGEDLREEIPETRDAEIAEVVLEGEDDMPAFPSFSSQDLADLVAFLRDLCGPYVGEDDDD